MDGFRRFYGEEIINLRELIEANKKRFIKLEYYEIKQLIGDSYTSFGVEIVKKEYTNNKFIEEVSNVNNITRNEQYIENIILKLKRNKVTPIGLKDIINELKE